MPKYYKTCNECGRDTTARSGLCGKCQHTGKRSHEEEVGRNARNLTITQGSPLADVDDDVLLRSGRTYHGGTVRDDL